MYTDIAGAGLFINNDEVAIVCKKRYHIYK